MMFVVSVFIASIVGIVAVFSIKYWELKRQIVIAPAIRARADDGAREFKHLLGRSRVELMKLPPVLLYLSRVLVHMAALKAASSARYLERQAHRLADVVSHKHRFERRAPRSEFLKQMNEHPIRDPRSNGAGKQGSSSEFGESENI